MKNHLTVGVVEYEQLGFLHTGAASGSCKELQQMIKLRFMLSQMIGLDYLKNLVPIIMIGTVGIAPFKHFYKKKQQILKERIGYFGNHIFR